MNPFVNPNQRGIDLPPGCKDLIDVLKPASSDTQSPREIQYLRGPDAEYLEEPFHHFYEAEDNPIIALFDLTCPGCLSLSRNHRTPLLILTFESAQSGIEEAIRKFFEARHLAPHSVDTSHGYSTINYPLPATALEAAELISNFLQQVYRTSGPVQLAYLPNPPTTK